MKRRKLRAEPYVQDGPNGRPAGEILKRWMRRGGKRHLRRMERREAKRDLRSTGL